MKTKIKRCPFCGAEVQPHHLKEFADYIFFIHHNEECFMSSFDNSWNNNNKEPRVISKKPSGGISNISSIETWNKRYLAEERLNKLKNLK